MAKNRIDMKALAKNSMRWFALPPEGFDFPGENFRAIVGFSAMRHNRDELSMLSKQLGIKEKETITLAISSVNAGKWLTKNGSTVFVEAETVRMCKNTEAIDGLRTTDLNIGIPFCYFKLPKEEEIELAGHRYGDCIAILENDEDINYISISWFGDAGSSPISMIFDLCRDEEISKIIDEGAAEDTKLMPSSAFCRSGDESGFILPLELSKKNYRFLMGLTLNFLLIVQSYPQYLTAQPNNPRNISFSKENKPITYVLSRSSVKTHRQVVSQRNNDPAIGTHDSPHAHWRRGHWRRQPHGDQFEIENPNVKVILFPDGRHYHMKWLIPVYVGHEMMEQSIG